MSVQPIESWDAAEASGPAPVDAPSWLEGARRYRTEHHRVAHHDGTCDSMYPGTWLDRDGRCVLPEGHPGPHLYRRELEAVPTREEAYQAERQRKIRERLTRERAARVKRSVGYPG